MSERDRTRLREREAEAIPETNYEKWMRHRADFRARQRSGQVVVRSTDREYENTRQGKVFYYLNPLVYKDAPLQDWLVFTQDIRKHSGKHRHQGGLVIYVIEGRGYSIVDGERIEWEEGDLLLLPIRPGGTEHQHFNHAEAQGCRWIAFCFIPFVDNLASELTQTEVSPLFNAGG